MQLIIHKLCYTFLFILNIYGSIYIQIYLWVGFGNISNELLSCMYYVWNDEMSRVTYALLPLSSRDTIGTKLKEPGDVTVPLGEIYITKGLKDKAVLN